MDFFSGLLDLVQSSFGPERMFPHTIFKKDFIWESKYYLYPNSSLSFIYIKFYLY